MTRQFTVIAGGALLLATAPAFAQAPPDPPKVLRIFRADMKPGKEFAFEKVSAGYSRAFTKGKYPVNYLGMTAAAGPAEAWFIEGHDSFESIDKAESYVEKNATLRTELGVLGPQGGDLSTGGRTMLLSYRPDMSYHPGQFMSTLPKMRCMLVEIFRVRPGHDPDFSELGHSVIAANEKAGIEESVVVYQLSAGGFGGTYMVFAGMPSLKFMDDSPTRGAAMMRAMSDPKRFFRVLGEAVVSTETLVFSLSPKMSYVSKDFAAVDPGYWNPAAPKPVAVKSGGKAGTGK